jgi:Tfp pilus assembly protein PilF
MDDNIVVTNNKMVAHGLKAIPKIFKSHYAKDGKQSYEYRPVVIASFAIEKQFFDKLPTDQTKQQKLKKDKLTQANISHFINVLLYALTCILLFNFLKVLFKEYNILLSFIITLIFLVHPLHTEVVSSIKNRDEIFTFLFIILALFSNLKHANSSKIKHLILSLVFTLFAILSKKSGLALFALIPMVLYFSKNNYKRVLLSLGTFVLAFLIVKFMKVGFLGDSTIRNFKYFENPLFFEGGIFDRITVGLYCSWFYLKMLIFPIDMSFYYGYDQIPMADWSYYQVWLALLFFVPLGIYGCWLFVKRKVLGFGILLMLGLMIPFLNVLMPMVGIVADRFTYQLSFGFSIIVGYILLKIFKIDVIKETNQVSLSNSFLLVFSIIILVYSGRTIIRNPNWHDQMSLYDHDIKHLTESAKGNALLANVLYPFVAREMQTNPMNPENKKNVEKLIFHYKEAIRIDSTYSTSINNLGSVYMNFKKDYNQTIYYCSRAVALDEDYLEAQFNLGYAYNAIGQVDEAIPHFVRVMEIKPDYMQVYKVYNKMVYESGKLSVGIDSIKKAAKNTDEPKNIYLNIGNLYSLDSYNVEQSLVYFVKAFEQDKSDKQLCNHISTLYNSLGDAERANFYYSLCNN